MRTTHRLSIAGAATIVALAAISPFALSVLRETSTDSAAVVPAYDYGTVDYTGGVSTLTYSTYPGGGLTITPSKTNSGANAGWGSGGTSTNVAPGSTGRALSMNNDDWAAAGNATSATYTPTSIWGIGGSTPTYYGSGVCNTTVAAGTAGSPVVPTIADCPNAGTANAPTITYAFSQPVTDWSISINDLGGFKSGVGDGGVTMYADWVITSGQTLSLVSSNNNFQVTGGNTIKVVSPPVTGISNASGSYGIGAGTVKVAGTYSSITFRLDYHIANFATNVTYTPDANNPPDWMAVQWGLSPAVALTYDGNGGSCTTAASTVPPATSVTIASGSGCSRSGYVFAGWNTLANGTGTGYAAGSSLTLNADTTLYAVWTPAPAPAPAPATDSGSTSPAAPRAVSDTAATPVNTPVTVNAAANDTYPAGSVFSQVTSPANGTVAWNANGSYTYSPRTGFSGVDTFGYKVCLAAPNSATCSSATETIIVGPLAFNDSAITQAGTPVSVNAALNDNYPAGSVFTQTSNPANGTVMWNANGSYVYTPRPGFVGTDTFTYKVCMPTPYADRCSQATDTITVGEPEPKARPQTQRVLAGSTRPLLYLPVGLSKPAAGSNLKPGSVAIAQAGTGQWGNTVVVPGKGTWVLKGTQVQFVPAPGFTGQTTIRYRIQDRNGKWAYSTLTATAPAVPTTVNGGW